METFKGRRPGLPCRVITLTYKNSIEEQQFLTQSKREIKAFEDLIKEKETLAKRPDFKAQILEQNKKRPSIISKYHTV